MKYFKNAKGEVFAYESDGSQDAYIPDGMTSISEADALKLASTPQTTADLAASVRANRDAQLLASDWVVIRAQEAGTPVPTDWMKYRQDLRDIPLQPDFPEKISWPDAPGRVNQDDN